MESAHPPAIGKNALETKADLTPGEGGNPSGTARGGRTRKAILDRTAMQISPRNQPPTQQILDAMAKLAEENVLGYANGATETLERMFQDRLCDLLNLGAVESGWTWQREIRFRTQALRNAESVSVDIFGRDRDGQDRAAIELKYVPTRQIGHHAPNPPAFPYDLIKDCLKVELLASGHSTPVDGSFAGRPAFGYAIGLTNVPKIINGTMKGWSRHFLSALRPGMAMDGGAFPLGPCMIESWSRSNLDGVIYAHRRHHICLGKSWNGTWSRFGEGDFRCVMLSTDFRDGPPVYKHACDDSRYIPFLTETPRSHALQRAGEVAPVRKRA